jgi:hypothetical protein
VTKRSGNGSQGFRLVTPSLQHHWDEVCHKNLQICFSKKFEKIKVTALFERDRDKVGRNSQKVIFIVQKVLALVQKDHWPSTFAIKKKLY